MVHLIKFTIQSLGSFVVMFCLWAVLLEPIDFYILKIADKNKDIKLMASLILGAIWVYFVMR